MYILVHIATIFSVAYYSNSYKILGLFPFPGRSHYAVFDPLMMELAKRGHEVTVYSTFPKNKSIKNFTDMDISECFPRPSDAFFAPTKMLSFADPFTCLMLSFNMIPKYEDIINCSELMKLLETPPGSYDLLVTETIHTDLFIIFAYKLKVPFIGMEPNVMLPWISERIGNPDNPSYIPQMLGGYLPGMNFFQRLRNTYLYVMASVLYRYFSYSKTDEISRKLLGSSVPPIREIVKNTSIQFTYTHFSVNPIRPLVPAVVDIGGINVKSPALLPKDIEKFLNESKHGVIYFCMGSLLRGASFPEDKRNAFLHAFSKLPQRVLWKWEGDELPGKSDKIMISKWMPQRDILAHPNIKLFISHGGLLGTSEAVYEGVPIIGIPIFGDQRTNVRAIEAAGAGEILDYNEISNDVVLKKIQTVLNNPKYRENAKLLSERYKDRPMSPLDTAVYWTEYVIRHKGAHHLRTAAVDMPWYQYLLLDVIAFVLIVFIASLVIIYYILKFLLRLIRRPFSKPQVPSAKKIKTK